MHQSKKFKVQRNVAVRELQCSKALENDPGKV